MVTHKKIVLRFMIRMSGIGIRGGRGLLGRDVMENTGGTSDFHIPEIWHI